MEITSADWDVIRRVLSDGFASSFHFAVASVGEDGAPHVTPIGSLLLGDIGRGVYFERYAAAGLGRRLEGDRRVCFMGLNTSRWELLKALWRGEVRRPFGVRLHGTVGAPRDATAEELARFRRRVHHLRFLRGHALVWGKLQRVRDVTFHAFEPVTIGPLGDPWPRRAPPA